MPYTAPASSPTSGRVRTVKKSKPPVDLIRHGRHNSEPVLSMSTRPEGTPQPSSRSYMYRHRRSPTVAKSVVDLHSELQRSYDYLGGDRESITKTTTSSSSHSTSNKASHAEQNGHQKDANLLAELGSAVIAINGDNPALHTAAKSKGAKPSSVEDLTLRLNQALGGRTQNEGRRRVPATSGSAILDGPSDVAVQTPEESDSEEGSLRTRPPMIRKKSGELVRPAIRKRPSSMPGTPSLAKAVHFDPHEEIRHFGEVDRPAALSVDSSPLENYETDTEFPFGQDDPISRRKDFLWEAEIVNCPSDRSLRDSSASVQLNRIFVSPDNRHLVGIVTVANLAFHKLVAARFTLDYWKTVSEVSAEYADVTQLPERPKQGEDAFVFHIDLSGSSNLDEKRMFMCIRYNVNGQEFWDNNNFMNYHVKFTWRRKPKSNGVQNVRPDSAPRSRSVPSLPGLVQKAVSKTGSTRQYYSAAQGPSEDPSAESPIRVSPASWSIYDFGNRYDVRESLSAALLMRDSSSKGNEGFGTAKLYDVSNSDRVDLAHSTSLMRRETSSNEPQKHSDLMPERFDGKIDGYRDLIDRYSVFGSPEQFVQTENSPTQHKNGVAGDMFSISHRAEEQSSQSSDSSTSSSRSNSPIHEKVPVPKLELLEPRRASPNRLDADRPRSSSPRMMSSYSSGQPMKNSFLSDTPQPTAILG